MKCPNCDQVLAIAERNNVEIDYCPNCRGVWLDKGELDKIISYVEQKIPELKSTDQYNAPIQDAFGHNYKSSYHTNRPHKKKSFFGEFFDFD